MKTILERKVEIKKKKKKKTKQEDDNDISQGCPTSGATGQS